MTEPTLPPVKIAFVIDGVVADVLHTDDRLGAIFLSEPTIVDVTGILPDTSVIGKQFVDGQFVDPITN